MATPIVDLYVRTEPQMAADRALLEAAKRAREWFRWKVEGRGRPFSQYDDLLIGRQLHDAITRVELANAEGQ